MTARMTDAEWLVVAIVAGIVIVAFTIAREGWIHRRRRRKRESDTPQSR